MTATAPSNPTPAGTAPPDTWSRAFYATCVPRPRLAVSTWADTYRVIPRGTSPEPGRWRTSRIPYLRGILDAISDPGVERVVVMAASQIGKTELILCVIGYYAHQDPSPILLVQPTQEAMESFSKERVETMFRATPALRGKLSDSLRDKNNTVLLKQFPGGYLACAWATSSVGLASRPIRVLLMDEVDKYPLTTGKDGDPIAQAEQRTSNFANRKIVKVSTPTIADISPIETAYLDSDQSRYWVPCLRCGALQVLRWDQLKYKNAAGEIDLDGICYRCEHCDGRIEERDKPEMLAAGEWRAEHPEHRTRGFHVSSLLSPWVQWRDLAEQWIRVHKNRDRAGRQEFVNLRLGEPWVEGDGSVTVEALEGHRETYAAPVPDEVLVLTAGVDVQDNRFEAEIVGWGVGRESWGVQYQVIPGDTSKPAAWLALDQFLARAWSFADGTALGLYCTCIDSGGHRTTEVYSFCQPRGARNIFAIKGRAGAGLPIAGKATTSNILRLPLIPVGVDTAKEAIFSRLAIRDGGPGYCHFPRDIATGYDADWFRGLLSERRVPKIRAGRRVLEWVQLHSRNEPLDCRVYATAAMELLNPDFVELARLRERLRGAAAHGAAVPTRRRIYSRGVS